jgi:16S rRNA C1402 (ribose-2'-O) methylase RsmI
MAQNTRGEITLVIGGAPQKELWEEGRVRAALAARLAKGESRSQAAKAVAVESGWRKGDIYALDES